MSATYPVDLIAKRDRKEKMDRSIVKGWNVHIQTKEEIEEAEREKRMEEDEKKALEIYGRLMDEADQDEDIKRQEVESAKLEAGEYNATTGSYSGGYGKKPVESEDAKRQIDAILSEKSDVFGSAMSAMKNEQ